MPSGSRERRPLNACGVAGEAGAGACAVPAEVGSSEVKGVPSASVSLMVSASVRVT